MNWLWVLVVLVALALVAHVLDWRQTLTIAKSNGRWYEKLNPVLGRTPTVRQVHSWFAITAVALVLFIAVAWYAWGWLSFAVAATWFGVEAWVVRRNHFLGIGV